MSEKQVHPHDLTRKVAEDLPRDFLRQVLLNVLTQFMESEVSMLCAATYGSRTDDRQNSRNGYRERELETRLGTVPLAIPRVQRIILRLSRRRRRRFARTSSGQIDLAAPEQEARPSTPG